MKLTKLEYCATGELLTLIVALIMSYDHFTGTFTAGTNAGTILMLVVGICCMCYFIKELVVRGGRRDSYEK